jgi:hypothetical protein
VSVTSERRDAAHALLSEVPDDQLAGFLAVADRVLDGLGGA